MSKKLTLNILQNVISPNYLITLLPFLIFCCQQNENQKNTKVFTQKDSSIIQKPINMEDDDHIPDDINMATCYVVIADTGKNYYLLRNKMLKLNKEIGITIDTMGRYYDEEFQGIILPKDDEDELYAGTYYPRRYPSIHLSLEYLNIYQQNTDETTIALVTAISDDKREADSILSVIKNIEPKAYRVKTNIYLGCFH
ncbi:MAG: hypothetical protein R3A43_01750 [Bacteroidia bacterium]